MYLRRFFFVSTLFAITSSVLSFTSLADATASPPDLSTLREKAQQRIESHFSSDWMNHQSASLSRWLIGAPTLEISALQSNQATGTDEIEVRLGVQLQRPDNLDLFDRMDEVNDAILTAQQRQQALLVSGLVRQRTWDAALARQQVIALSDKQEWLQQLGNQLTERFNAGELSRFAYLQWQQQQLDVEQALLAAQAQLNAAMQAYQDLTGVEVLPAEIAEVRLSNLDTALNSHPEFRLLSLQQQYAAAAYEYSRQSQSNWNVALVARRLQSVLGDENQVGLAVGIPLTINAPANPSDLQAWQQTDLALSQSLMNLRISLHQQLTSLQAELTALNAQVEIARRQVEIGEQIVEQLGQLRQNSELEQSNWLQSLLEQRDRTYQLDKMILSRQQMVAQINQLAGQVL